MSNDQVIAAACPQCGKKFRMRVELAGRLATCPCGFQFKVPKPAWSLTPTAEGKSPSHVHDESAPASAADTLKDDDFETPTASPLPIPDSRFPNPAPAPPDGPQGQAATRISPVMAALLQREDEVQESPWRNVYVPAISLVVGQSIAVLLWIYWMRGWPARFGAIATALAVQALILLPVMVAACFMAAKWLDMPLGPLRATLIRAVAITFGFSAIADVLYVANLVLVEFDWGLLVAGFGYYLILTGLLIAFLFEVGVRETAFIIAINFLPRTIAVYIAATYLRQSNLFG